MRGEGFLVEAKVSVEAARVPRVVLAPVVRVSPLRKGGALDAPVRETSHACRGVCRQQGTRMGRRCGEP